MQLATEMVEHKVGEDGDFDGEDGHVDGSGGSLTVVSVIWFLHWWKW